MRLKHILKPIASSSKYNNYIPANKIHEADTDNFEDRNSSIKLLETSINYFQ